VKHKNISRVKTAKTDGWQVRIRRNGKPYSKFFPLKNYQGKIDVALEAAIDCRDDVLKLAPEPDLGAAAVKKGRDDGIHRYVERNKHGEYPYWVAAWTDPAIGKRKSRKFSITKHGNLRAKQMAREARMRGVAGMRQADADNLQDREEKQIDAILDFLAS